MQKENNIIIENFKKQNPGWNSLLDTVIQVLEFLPDSVSIQYIEKKYGILKIKFNHQHLNSPLTYAINALSYKVERDSVKVCHICGNRGSRRKNLNNDVYCFSCWLIASNSKNPNKESM